MAWCLEVHVEDDILEVDEDPKRLVSFCAGRPKLSSASGAVAAPAVQRRGDLIQDDCRKGDFIWGRIKGELELHHENLR